LKNSTSGSKSYLGKIFVILLEFIEGSTEIPMNKIPIIIRIENIFYMKFL